MRMSCFRGPLIVITLAGLTRALSQSPAPFPEPEQLVGLLRHAVRWHHQWQVDTGDQGLLNRKATGGTFFSRSLFVSTEEPRQIWSFIPALGVQVTIVFSVPTRQWKLLSIADGESYRGKVDDVVARYVRDQLPDSDFECAGEVSVRIAGPSGQRKQLPSSAVPLSRPCAAKTSSVSPSFQTVDAQLTTGPLLGSRMDSDLACQREATEITLRWVLEFDRSMSGHMVVPACSLLDPKVFVLLERRSGEPNVLTLFRDMDGQLVHGKVIERQEVVKELSRRIRLTSTMVRVVPG